MIVKGVKTSYNLNDADPITVDEGEMLADLARATDPRPMMRKLVEGRIGKRVGSIPFDDYMILCLRLATVYRFLKGDTMQSEFNDAFAKFDAVNRKGNIS